MFVLAHLAAGYLVGRVWNVTVRRHPINVWVAMLGGILSDLIDKPLALLPWWTGGRSIAHSLLFLVVVFAFVKVHRFALPLALGIATHLILDDPTRYAQSLLWPVLGTSFTPDEDLSPDVIHLHLTKLRTGFAEIVGGLVLVTVGLHHFVTTMNRPNVQIGRVPSDAVATPSDE